MNKRIAFNRQTKDFDMYLNDRYVGSRASHQGAQAELDDLVYEALTHTCVQTDEELVALAAPLIDMLDDLMGDCDYEADCDESAAPVWRIGAFIAARVAA